MKFLFVLRENELHWRELLETSIQEQGGEVVTVQSIKEAQELLKDKQFKVDEVITGTFGDLEGPWKYVQKAAAERRMGITLLTGYPMNDHQKEVLNSQNVRILEKQNFDMNQFIAERFPVAGRTEAR